MTSACAGRSRGCPYLGTNMVWQIFVPKSYFTLLPINATHPSNECS